MHFLSPVFIRVRRLRDPLSSLGITGTSAPLVHPRAESLLLVVPLPSPVYVRYAPARARHTRCNLRGSSVLPMSPISSSFVRLFVCLHVFTCNYTRRDIYAACGELIASFANECTMREIVCEYDIMNIYRVSVHHIKCTLDVVYLVNKTEMTFK